MLLRFNIPAIYPGVRVIHIVRSSAFEQAVSFSIADQTNLWISKYIPDGSEASYSFQDIAFRARRRAGDLLDLRASRRQSFVRGTAH